MTNTADQTPTGIEAFDRVWNKRDGRHMTGTVHNVSFYNNDWFLCILWDYDADKGTTDDSVPFTEVEKV